MAYVRYPVSPVRWLIHGDDPEEQRYEPCYRIALVSVKARLVDGRDVREFGFTVK